MVRAWDSSGGHASQEVPYRVGQGCAHYTGRDECIYGNLAHCHTRRTFVEPRLLLAAGLDSCTERTERQSANGRGLEALGLRRAGGSVQRDLSRNYGGGCHSRLPLNTRAFKARLAIMTQLAHLANNGPRGAKVTLSSTGLWP